MIKGLEELVPEDIEVLIATLYAVRQLPADVCLKDFPPKTKRLVVEQLLLDCT